MATGIAVAQSFSGAFAIAVVDSAATASSKTAVNLKTFI
jgi:hypothetical protein